MDDILSTYQVAQILNLTRQHVTRLCREGKLEARRYDGRHWVVTREALERYLKERYRVVI